MADRIHYNGSDKWKSKATDVINDLATEAGGNVDDVMVDGVSVVDADKIAQIDLTPYAETAELATVATTGDYDDLINKPTIPAAQVQSDWLEADSTKKSYILNKPTIPSTAADVGAIPTTEKGANSGVAELDANGKVPSSQLPSYVDDAVEVADYASLPSTGETGKIYITLDDNKTYRWSGSAYVEISPSLALGETSSTAYRGDRGKTAYDHATETKAGQTASGLYKIGVTAEGHVASATAVSKSDITALGIPASDTNTTYTLGTSGNNVTLTPSSGSAQSVTAPYATNAGKVNYHTVGMDIPTPTAGDETKYLGGDGTFQEVSPKREASGSVVSFSDGSTYPLSKCMVDIEPKQDLHGYDSPWPDGGGVNKLPTASTEETKTASVGFKVTSYADGHYHLSKTASGASDLVSFDLANSVEASSGMYFISKCSVSNGSVTIGIRDASNNIIKEVYLGNTSPTAIGATGTATKIVFFVAGAVDSIEADVYPMLGASVLTSWTPYSNICPISGWTAANVVRCGVNVWDEEWEVGDIDIQGVPTASTKLIRTKDFNPCKPNTTYRVIKPNASVYMKYYDKDKNFIYPSVSAGNTITTPTNCYYFKFVIGSAYGTTYNNDISINYPSTDTAYHPYQGNTYTISFGSAGTVYGGTLNVLTGELVVDRAMVDMGSLSWSLYNTVFYATVSGIEHGKTRINILSDRYATANAESNLGSGSSWVNGTIRGNSATAEYIYIKDTSYSSASAFKTAMDGVMACIPLATPQTYTLTPTQISTLLGNNTIYADTGDIDVEYVKEPFEGIYDNDKVRQTNTTANSDYRVLLSGSADDTEHKEGANKSGGLKFNPSKKTLNIGENNTVTSNYSLAFGGGCIANGNFTVALGASCTASNSTSLARGGACTASGDYSTASGRQSTASGDTSYAQGIGANANHKSQYVIGEYNALDTSTAQATARGNYVEIVGNGTSNNARSNARTLDWSGNETLAGKLTVGANPTNAMDVATKDYVDGLIAALRQQLGL